MQDGFVATADHGRIHYLEEGHGPALVLLHSNGNSAYEYDQLIPLLSSRFRVLAMDFPGHGDSEPLRRHYSVGDYADATCSFLKALQIEKMNVLGSSIGGAVCVNLGVRYAHLIDRLFVVESPVRTESQWKERWLATEAAYACVIQSEDQVRPRLRNLTKDVLERWNIDRAKAGTWAMIDVMWALREYDVLKDIPCIKTRTAVIYGAKSPHPHALSVFERDLPSAHRIKMENCGHFPMLDDPAALADHILTFHGS